MRVIILGAGQVGGNIARYLALEDNDVTVVDHSTEVLKKLSNTVDIQPIVGHASHPDVLDQAGTEDADLILAVTSSDEINIVACGVAHSLFNVETKIARIRSQDYLNPYWAHLFSPNNLPVDVIISPEIEVATSVRRNIEVMGSFNVISLLDDQLKCVGFKCANRAAILNTPLRLVPNLFPKLNIVILTIARGDKTFIPDGDDQILIGDEVHILIESEQLHEVSQAFGLGNIEGRRILIIGAGNIGLSLASEIEKRHRHISCKIIEMDPKRAEFAAKNLQHTEVLCGDGLDVDVLREANAQLSEMVIAVTDDDKVNILSSLLAKRQGTEHAISLLNHSSYVSFVKAHGVDAVINPKTITISSILQHIRQGRIRAIHSLYDDFAELLDVEARETSAAVGLSLGEIATRGETLVAALIRDDAIIFAPNKNTFLRIDDRLILVVSKTSIKKIEKMFSIRTGYL